MNGRNSYFASVFSRELDRWKKENRSTQADFSELTGIHPNSLSRYRKGETFPTEPVINEICNKLGVDKSIFYPQTFAERFESDESFREYIFYDMAQREKQALSDVGINTLFWRYLLQIPNVLNIFPFSQDETYEDTLFLKILPSEKTIKVNKKDLDLVLSLQEEVTEYITMLLIKKSLQQRLDAASDAAPFLPILMALSKDLIHCNRKETANGDD